jgi:glycosyltransferase involved in cell wall biosynthesis
LTPGLQFGSSRPLVVVTSMTRWDEAPRIRHQVTRQLARFFNVLYVELPLTRATIPARYTQISESLIAFRPASASLSLRRLRNHFQLFRALHDRALARLIEAAIVELGYQSAVLVNFQFDFATIMRSPVFTRRLYLCNDDFQTSSRPWARSLNERSEVAVIRQADLCLAVSQPLVDKLKRATPHAELFLPGHEFAPTNPAAVADTVRARSEPIHAVCMGFINGRLRMDWLGELASSDGILLSLIGPIEAACSDLLSLKNVTHVEALVGADLQKKMLEADVFVMPYDTRQEAVRAIAAPNKLFQYLACGRPVVSSNLPHLIDLPSKFLYVADTAQRFVQAVRKAFSEDDRSATLARLEYAAGNSWDVRGESLRALVRTELR